MPSNPICSFCGLGLILIIAHNSVQEARDLVTGYAAHGCGCEGAGGMSEKWYVISGLGSRRLQLNWTESGPSLNTHHIDNDNLRSVCAPWRRHPLPPSAVNQREAYILDLHCVAWIWTCASTADWLLVTAHCLPRLHYLPHWIRIEIWISFDI